MREKIIKAITTCCYIGYIPRMPGTWATLAGMAAAILVRDNIYISIAALCSVLAFGLIFAGKAEELFGKKDDCRIVIDELFGATALFLSVPDTFPCSIAGFILFRIFDITKPFPIRRLHDMPGSWGIMADDIFAAICSYIIIKIWGLLMVFL